MTATYSTDIVMVPAQSYIGTLYHDESFAIYKVDDYKLNKTGALVVEFAGCKGEPEFSFVKSSSQTEQLLKENTE